MADTKRLNITIPYSLWTKLEVENRKERSLGRRLNLSRICSMALLEYLEGRAGAPDPLAALERSHRETLANVRSRVLDAVDQINEVFNNLTV